MSKICHTLPYIPWSHDLIERNNYSRSNQIDKVTEHSETYEGSDHLDEQSYKESVPIRSYKCRFYDVLWLRW